VPRFYVVNLARRVDRLARMIHIAESLGFSFSTVSAVDASAGDFVNSYAAWRHKSGPTGALGAGSVACALSHMLAWRSFLDDAASIPGADFECAVVLEDDVVLSDDFVRVVRDLRAQSMLGYGLIKLELGGPMSRGAFLGKTERFQGARCLRRSFQVLPDAAAYMLSRDTARYLLEFADQICVPIDHFLFYPVKGDGFHGAAYAIVDPAVAIQDRSLESDISSARYTDTRSERDKLRFFYEARQVPMILGGILRGSVRFCRVGFR